MIHFVDADKLDGIKTIITRCGFLLKVNELKSPWWIKDNFDYHIINLEILNKEICNICKNIPCSKSCYSQVDIEFTTDSYEKKI